MLVRTSGETPKPSKLGVILDPNFFEGLFFWGRSKVKRSKLGVILLRSIPLLSRALRDPTAPGRRAPSRFAPFFSPPKPPEGGLVWYCQ